MVVTYTVPINLESQQAINKEPILTIEAPVHASETMKAGLVYIDDAAGAATLAGVGAVNVLGVALSGFANAVAAPTPEYYTFVKYGLCWVQASAAIAKGAYLKCAANGQVATAGTNLSVVKVPIVGRAFDTAGAGNDWIRAWIGMF